MASVKQKKRPKTPAAVVPNGEVSPSPEPVPPAVRTPVVRKRPASRQRLKRDRLAEHLERAAGLAAEKPVTRRLKQLARTLTGKSVNDRRRTHGASLVAECLDFAVTASGADRWAACEAAAWSVAWLARREEGDASCGELLERVVHLADAALDGIEHGDLAAAPFVLVVAGLFADVESCRPLGQAARTSVEEQIERFVGAEGGLRLDDATTMLQHVCCWVRCREAITAAGGKDLSRDILRKLDLAVAFAVRLLGNDARPLEDIGPGPRRGADPLMRAASQGRKKLAATVLALTEGRETSGSQRWSQKGLLTGSLFDEDASVAVLRSGWKRGSVRVVVSFQADVPHLEIVVGNCCVTSGPWEVAIDREGTPLPLVGGWTRSWWEGDEDAVYFEMSAELAGGWRLDRSVLVLRDDQIVLLGDAVVLPEAGYGDRPEALAGKLALRSAISVPPTLDLEACDETREVFGADLKPRLLALPLGLSEWRQREAGGSLNVTGRRLELTQSAAVSRLYAPLWIDLNAGRLKRLKERPAEEQLTWRQLTVADTREILTADQAAGFRVQEGLDQWLVYRSLDEARNRSVLGCNISSEFLAGRLRTDGEVDRAIEVTEGP